MMFSIILILIMIFLSGYVISFVMGALPIPVGYDRGKVKWVHIAGFIHKPIIVYRVDGLWVMTHPKDQEEN